MIPPRELFLPQDADTCDAAALLERAPPPVAACYLRLRANAEVGGIMDDLRRRGVQAREIETLYRKAALMALDGGAEEVESWASTLERRAALARQLRGCAQSIAQDRELGRMWLAVGGVGFGDPPSTLRRLGLDVQALPLSELLSQFAAQLGAAEPPERIAARPNRALSRRSYVLHALFALLAAHVPGRAPNRAAEIIASVVLETPIKPGTLTQLRRKQRRRYCREPSAARASFHRHPGKERWTYDATRHPSLRHRQLLPRLRHLAQLRLSRNQSGPFAPV